MTVGRVCADTYLCWSANQEFEAGFSRHHELARRDCLALVRLYRFSRNRMSSFRAYRADLLPII